MGSNAWAATNIKTVFFEPTDRRKAIKPFHEKHSLTYASPNLVELRAMANFMQSNISINKALTKINELDEIVELSKVILKYVKVLIITRGSKGVVTIKRLDDAFEVKELDVKVYSTDILNTVENVSGAGDCFASGFIHGILQDLQESQNISIGFEAAKQALLSKETVPLKFTSIMSK